jgi:DNA-binding transcriptional MerR regulator
MRIGQLAEASGISTDTIRYYERIGLLPRASRTQSGYREYPSGARNRVRIIRNAVQLGFPLQEIVKVLRVRDAGGAPCRQVRDYARTLVVELERRVEELKAERTAMVAMIAQWDGILEKTPEGTPAHLLEADVVTVRRAQPRHARLRRSKT